MKQQLETIRQLALKAIEEAEDQQGLENLRVKYLGKKGELTAILKQMGKLSAEERPVMGQLANDVRAAIEETFTQKAAHLKEALLEQRLKHETIDVTLPGKRKELGSKHPLSIVLDEIKEIFVGMGFDIVEGPMADDQIWDYVEDYISGNISKVAFWELVRFKYPTHQIAFCTEEALKTLHFEGSEVL